MPDEDWQKEWREAQEHRYDKRSLGSGRIDPFFRKLGAPNRRFGVQLLVIGALIAILPPLCGLRNWPLYVPLFILAVILCVGGVGHLRATRQK